VPIDTNPIVQGVGGVNMATAASATTEMAPAPNPPHIYAARQVVYNGVLTNAIPMSAGGTITEHKAYLTLKNAIVAKKSHVEHMALLTANKLKSDRKIAREHKAKKLVDDAHKAHKDLLAHKAAKQHAEQVAANFNKFYKSLWRTDKTLYDALGQLKASGASAAQLQAYRHQYVSAKA
jgi:hypothetical protein